MVSPNLKTFLIREIVILAKGFGGGGGVGEDNSLFYDETCQWKIYQNQRTNIQVINA